MRAHLAGDLPDALQQPWVVQPGFPRGDAVARELSGLADEARGVGEGADRDGTVVGRDPAERVTRDERGPRAESCGPNGRDHARGSGTDHEDVQVLDVRRTHPAEDRGRTRRRHPLFGVTQVRHPAERMGPCARSRQCQGGGEASGSRTSPSQPSRMARVLVRGRLIGVCGTDREIVDGRLRRTTARRAQAHHRPRGSRRGARGTTRLGLRARRPRGEHRPPPRSGSVPGVRRGRVGHVPQRRLRRTRDRPAPWVRQRAVARRTRVRVGHPARARRAGRAARAGVGVGQGVGPGRQDLRAGVLPPRPGAGHRRGADRAVGVPVGRPAWL